MKGNQTPVPDLTAQAQARLALARTASGAASGSAIPAAVWEDAERQLAGMLSALATLQADVPALGEPSVGGTVQEPQGPQGPQDTRGEQRR
jgi:hypothetical protein